MKKIYKYPLDGNADQQINVSEDYEILTVQLQFGTPCIWIIVDTSQKMDHVLNIKTIGTGHEVTEDVDYTYAYVGTYQMAGGSLVWHVFAKPTY